MLRQSEVSLVHDRSCIRAAATSGRRWRIVFIKAGPAFSMVNARLTIPFKLSAETNVIFEIFP